ncbi:hypothetical protein PRZ48_008492 [Zasmidium cellare]|uniref:Uncharacterized protein n=1 Tax=Zasmidium cellare TaxID=395010 RepID=A0ABR0EGV7_ZASCE|nr:hypothetical protein PRZ48_008492 [Zasmidium cellare]
MYGSRRQDRNGGRRRRDRGLGNISQGAGGFGLLNGYGQQMGGYGMPPQYDDGYDRGPSPRSQRDDYMHRGDPYAQSYDDQYCSTPQPPRRQQGGFRPLALPQITYGDGKPFLRGYSDELERYGISEAEFIPLLDKLNKAIIPNPENQIFQKAANIAGYFVPGAESIGIIAGQIGVGVAAAVGNSATLGKTLSKANLQLFIPKGLEICIGKGSNVDQESGYSASRQFTGEIDPLTRLEQYGDYLMPLSVVHEQQQNIGRQDPIAMIGRGMSAKDAQQKMQRAGREQQRGKRTKKGDSLEGSLQWLIVRKAQPDSVKAWQESLRQSEAALAKEQAEGRR